MPCDRMDGVVFPVQRIHSISYNIYDASRIHILTFIGNIFMVSGNGRGGGVQKAFHHDGDTYNFHCNQINAGEMGNGRGVTLSLVI